jgi:aspartyl-tRNA(Asn)/glutamyl-tRNA(Gln) amidotransferase subunit C
MIIADDTVREIAELARLELTEEETALYAQQLSQILDHFQHLQTVDTTQIPPMASVLPLKTVLREDVAGAPLPTAEVLVNAADTQDNQFRVRAVLDE